MSLPSPNSAAYGCAFARWFVPLSIRLSLCSQRKNEWMHLREIFRIGAFLGNVSFNPLHVRFLFLLFSGESVPVSNITETQATGFSWNVQGKLDMKQGTIWSISRMLSITRWILDPFFYFMDPCFISTLWETVNGFSWNFQDMMDRIRQNIWFDCFIPTYTVWRSPIRHVVMSVSNIIRKWVSGLDFHEIYRIWRVSHKEQSRKFCL